MSLKDFQIVSQLGKGSYSEVFKVIRIPDNQTYALKKVKIQHLSQREKNNALNEIRILASIDHPNIISYKQAFFDNGNQSLCIIMEYADGGDLSHLIHSSANHFSESFIWSLIIQLCRALKALNKLNIMHRDLKSANIFLFKNGVIKLGDMNVSKVIKNSLFHTQTGTPIYTSPEIWNNQEYDTKCDIWSLGCVVYEACAFKVPFEAPSLEQLYRKIMKNSFAPLTGYSRKINTIVSMMLTLNPNLRPSVVVLLKQAQYFGRGVLTEEAAEMNLLGTIKAEDFNKRKIQLPEPRYLKSASDKKIVSRLLSPTSADEIKRFKFINYEGRRKSFLAYFRRKSVK